MSKIITINRSGLENFGRGRTRGVKKDLMLNRIVLGMKKSVDFKTRNSFSREGNAENGFKRASFALVFVVILFGVCYLYQVNDLATKGYEIREIETQIAELKKNNEKNKIREVELRSMYSIEREVSNLDLVASTNAAYLDINGSVAMK